MFLYGGAIGDTLLGIHIGRVLSENRPGIQLVMLSTRKSTFARELTQNIPFVMYRELNRNNPISWIQLLGLMFTRWNSVVFDPFASPVSTWWKIILWCTSRYPGGIHIRAQIHEQKVPSYSRVFLYDSRKTNLFDTPSSILEQWGIQTEKVPNPSLPMPACIPPHSKPYIVFHFFAGSIRRSVAPSHARELLVAARSRFPHHTFIVTCARGEEELAKQIGDITNNVIIKVGLSAQEIVCLLSHASMCVGAASGITHIAAHLPTPSVVLCNLSDPCWLPLYNLRVALLFERDRCGCNGDKTGECSEVTEEGVFYRCLYDIKTETVIKAMEEKIEHS